MSLALINAINELSPTTSKLSPKLTEVVAVQCQIGQPLTPVLDTVYNDVTQYIVLSGSGLLLNWDSPYTLRFTYTDPATNQPVVKTLNTKVISITTKEIRLNLNENLAVTDADAGYFEVCDISGAPLCAKTVTCKNGVTG